MVLYYRAKVLDRDLVQNNPVNWVDPEGLKVSLCRRPFKPGEPGDKISTFSWFTKTYHEYNCVTLPNGTTKCDSTNAGKNFPEKHEEGIPSDPKWDYYDKDACGEIDDDKDQCVENCLLKKWAEKRPTYYIGPTGTDCQEYSANTFIDCYKQCNGTKTF